MITIVRSPNNEQTSLLKMLNFRLIGLPKNLAIHLIQIKKCYKVSWKISTITLKNLGLRPSMITCSSRFLIFFTKGYSSNFLTPLSFFNVMIRVVVFSFLFSDTQKTLKWVNDIYAVYVSMFLPWHLLVSDFSECRAIIAHVVSPSLRPSIGNTFLLAKKWKSRE